MIELTHGDILQSEADALVNTVNCVGVMGRGVALQFRNAYPDNFKAYKAVCDRGELVPGKMLTFDRSTLERPHYIINFPTKRHWKGKSEIGYVKAGLVALIAEVKRLGIRSLALPPLGCGLGGLDWCEVKPIIEHAFTTLPEVRVFLYEPAGAPAPASMKHAAKAPKMTHGRAILLALISRYLEGMMDTAVTLLQIQKLLYFMQEWGQPLRLIYEKGTYGPYSKQVRHVLNGVEGHFLLGFGDAEESPTREIELMDDAGVQADKFLEGDSAMDGINRVADLINGFETPSGMELLSTVHWVVTHDGAKSADDAVTLVHRWNERKKTMRDVDLRLTYDILLQKGWITPGAVAGGGEARS